MGSAAGLVPQRDSITRIDKHRNVSETENQVDDYGNLYKLVLIGDMGVGKTYLL